MVIFSGSKVSKVVIQTQVSQWSPNVNPQFNSFLEPSLLLLESHRLFTRARILPSRWPESTEESANHTNWSMLFEP
jgi:hypothetical protein